MQKNSLILGFGIASTAYLSLLDFNGLKATVVGSPLDTKRINLLKKNRKDKKNNLVFSKKIRFISFDEINEINKKKFDFVIIGTNSKGINWAVKIINDLKVKCPILLITKGLILFKKKIITLSQFISKKTKNKKIVMSAGPCLAHELIKKVHTRTIFSSSNIKNAEFLKKILENQYYHPDLTSDIIGAEICAAIKNLFSIVIGSSEGQSGKLVKSNVTKFFNPASALFEQSVKEMIVIVKKLGGNKETVSNLAGVGDLYVSVLGGRNSKLGYFLGKGMTYKNIISKKMRGITIEGAELAKELGNEIISLVNKKKLPLTSSLVDAINNNKKLKIHWKKFAF